MSDSINVRVDPGSEPGELRVTAQGVIDLKQTLGIGGLYDAMDEYLAGDAAAQKYGYRAWFGVRDDGSYGVPRAMAAPDGRATVTPDLRPEAVASHLWNNLDGDEPITYKTSLERKISVTSSLEVSHSLTLGVEVQVEADVDAGPASAKNDTSFKMEATDTKTASHSRTVDLGTTDEAEETLDPGHATLEVLSAEVGSLRASVPARSYWDGPPVRYQTKDQWRGYKEVSLAALMDHGLARPGDVHGTHGGAILVTCDVGQAGEVDQTAVAVYRTDEDSLEKARQQALAERNPQ